MNQPYLALGCQIVFMPMAKIFLVNHNASLLNWLTATKLLDEYNEPFISHPLDQRVVKLLQEAICTLAFPLKL